jgi:orotate phosphoribosyltransferase
VLFGDDVVHSIRRKRYLLRAIPRQTVSRPLVGRRSLRELVPPYVLCAQACAWLVGPPAVLPVGSVAPRFLVLAHRTCQNRTHLQPRHQPVPAGLAVFVVDAARVGKGRRGVNVPKEGNSMTNRQKLLLLIRQRALLKGNVTLASGRKSDFYIDGKMIEMHPEGAHLIGESLYELIEGMQFDAVGGLAVGAVPVVTSLVISCFHHRRPIEGFFVREEAKSHGTQKTIEGLLAEGASVVLVDDVITSGKSVLKAAEAAQHQRNAQIVAVAAIVDRDAGARQLFESHGYRYETVFSKQEVLNDAAA